MGALHLLTRNELDTVLRLGYEREENDHGAIACKLE